jgi:serine/threonine-protein kinase
MDVEALIAAGKYAEAAVELKRAGRLDRAQALYEKIWDFRSAAELARERGDRPDLLRLSIEAKDHAEAARVGRELLTAAPGEATRGAEVYERSRMWAEAAQLREALGQLAEAHALYKRAQLPLEAARLDETLGRPRDAGRAYEKLLAEEPNAPEAQRARLSLGRILAGFGRHEDAVRHLQKASGTDEQLSARARRLLVLELAALGYRDAAESVLDQVRAADGRIPGLDAFMANELLTNEPKQALSLLGGRYRVERLLGSGGMGRVYLAHDELSGRSVAVKVVAPPTDARLAEGYRRFVREARVVSSLQHPHLVAVVAFHEELGLLAMEYMAGGTLADRLASPLSPAQVRALGVELLRGLEAAHAHGVIHRDLKPQNVFYAASGEAKLGDFGVAHLQDLGATQTAGFIGTLAYMSPEQISGAPLSFASDIYGLGVTLFQALTGRLPFTGPDFVAQHLGETPPEPSSLREGLDPAWDRVLRRALEKDPRARWDSLEALRHAIAAVSVEGAARVQPTAAAAEPACAPDERYASPVSIATTAVSTVESATDTRLGRQVILERFAPGFLDGPGAAHLRWLRALARHGGPGLQRILRIERLPDGAHRVVYEAHVGAPAAPASVPRDSLLAVERALAALHAHGGSHGSVASSVIVEDWGSVLLVAGRAPSGTPDNDRVELAALTRA